MGLLDDKSKVFGEIAALRATTKGYLNNSQNSLSSISNSGDVMSFLIDLLKSLENYSDMKQVIIDSILYQSNLIENEIKRNLKKQLKDYSLCSASPTIPNFMLEGNLGVDVRVTDLDYLDIFKITPESELGRLVFNDSNNGLNSTDLNTYLSSVITNEGNGYYWGENSPVNKKILYSKFNKFGLTTDKNNTINFKISNDYQNKKISKFNDDFIDSIRIINSEELINALLDSFSGVLSFKSGKTKNKLKNIEEISLIIDKLIASDSNSISVDNSFFEFTNEESSSIEELVNNKNKGIFKIDLTENTIESNINFNDVVNLNSNLSATNNNKLKADLLNNALNSLGSLDGFNINPINQPIIKLNIIEQIVKNIVRVLVSKIIAPKILVIFIINAKMVYGDDFSDIKTFIKNNSNLFVNIINIIKPIIIKIILDKITKQITQLVERRASEILTEKAKNYSNQIQSLLGNNIDVNNLL